MSKEESKIKEDSKEKFYSVPNVRPDGGKNSEDRRLYSLSLSQIRKHSSQFSDYHHKPSPFSLRWITGWNPKAGVINLNSRGSTTVFYAACNCGILYNWTTNQMRILQGHRHMVNCIAADGDGKWLVTSDCGPENLITIWDSDDYFPNKTYFLPHGNMRVSKVALSQDSRFMLTLGYHEKTAIFWWIWSSGQEEPHAALNVDIPKDGVLAMEFNPDNTWQFVLMTKTDIWIGLSQKVFVMERGLLKETDDYELKIRMVEKKPEINMAFGKLTCFTFVSITSQILVGTSRGAIHVNGYTIEYQENIEPKSFEFLKFVKALKLEDTKINVIRSIDGVIVTGNNGGQIRFYDEQLKLLHWLQDLSVDRVRSISFNISPRSYKIIDLKCGIPKKCPCWENVETERDPVTGIIRQKLIKKNLPTDATTSGKTFLVRDFIVTTGNQGIGFVDFVTEKLATILDYRVSSALCVTVHPEKPYLCQGFADGVLDLVNFSQHKLFARIDLREHYKVVVPPSDDCIKYEYEVNKPELSVTCLKYAPSGLHLACGLNTGQLLFLDPVTIRILTQPFNDSQHAIKDINYSCDSLTLAFSDAGHTVCVYKYDCKALAWTFIAKHRAHYKDITAVFFTPVMNDNGDYKLLSLGADRIMVEYNIGASSGEHLEIFSLDRMDQTAVPLAGFHWPTPKEVDAESQRTDLPMILVANDEYKYKIVNYATAMTLATVLGPRFESPVSRMQLVSRKEEQNVLEYILFATKNIIGLQKLPLDGNPWKHVGILGHPIQITDMCYREDLGTLFTQGARDICMCQWAANYRAVDSTCQQGGIDLDPYYCLIENGRPGWLFQEIRDLFYYIQILCQGTFSPTKRTVKDYIPIDSLPDLMRALGFFPSEYEVENLLTEAKFKVYQPTPFAEVDFEEFVKLYLNHRPAFGEELGRVRNAFRTFASLEKEDYVMSRDEFVDMLGSYGECFSRDLSWYLLSILLGHSFEDRASMPEDDYSFLPETISLRDLLINVMGIQEVELLGDQFSARESFGSSWGSSVTGTSDDRERNN
ncbi:cilia- and flagella-associated protein 251-like [Cydia strobilella]|uniref:cilia- and flagella-associated protein 251-like n=1 Tax=Cydia strobilella TaxID=1100964 RepID=UPI003005B344